MPAEEYGYERVWTCKSQAGPLLTAAGGIVMARMKVGKAVAGVASYPVCLVMEYSAKQDIEEVFASAECQALVPHHVCGFRTMNIVIADLM